LCGIAGFTHVSFRPGPERIREAAASIRHRGPDQQGIFESNGISLAARRLKIIDLESGDQPIFSADGDTAIVFNGEIYNHAELRRELERRGHRFRSHSDTEVVLAAFLEWDLECFARLRGMFAMALWSESRGRLVLARDRMGIKPLYVARRGRDLYFASEIKAIFVHPEVERNLDPAALDCYLSMNYVPAPYTMVQGIEKLRPGCWLEWQGGQVRSEPFWKLPCYTDPNWSIESAKNTLDSLLKQSIREHLLSDVPLGIWLSGGLDSSTLLHYATAASSSRLKTFSISFAGRKCDESAHIRHMAERYETEHEEFDVNPESGLADAIEQFAYYFDEPNADGGALPVWFLSRLTRASVTVALSGEGADELFGGYLTYRADQLARRLRRLPAWLLRASRGAARLWPVSDEKLGFEYMLKRFAEGCLMPAGQAHVYWNGAFSAEEKAALVSQPLPAALAGMLRGLSPEGDDLETYLRFDQRWYLPDDILAKVDRMSMAHSIEVRPPFLDHRIVEFAASLPEHLKVRGKRQKIVLRELMRRKLPASTLRRKKEGFDFPAHEWLRGPLRGLLLDTVSAGRGQTGLFRRDALENCVRQHLNRRTNLGYHLWGLMLLLLWMKRWRIQTAQTFDPDREIPASIFTFT
jgi:asparagine synthase (glutamine-hydrolysing)